MIPSAHTRTWLSRATRKICLCAVDGGTDHRPDHQDVMAHRPCLVTALNDPTARCWRPGAILIAPGIGIQRLAQAPPYGCKPEAGVTLTASASRSPCHPLQSRLAQLDVTVALAGHVDAQVRNELG